MERPLAAGLARCRSRRPAPEIGSNAELVPVRVIARVKDQVGRFNGLARAQPAHGNARSAGCLPLEARHATHVIAPPELHPLLLHVARTV